MTILSDSRYREFRPYMERVVRESQRAHSTRLEEDDLEDTLLNAFLYADKTYNADRGASFRTYLGRVLLSRLSSLATKRARQYRLGKSSAKSIYAVPVSYLCNNLTVEKRQQQFNVDVFGDLLDKMVVDTTSLPELDILPRLRRRVSDSAFRLIEEMVHNDFNQKKACRTLGITTADGHALLEEVGNTLLGAKGKSLTEEAQRLHLITA
jgi:hypothetical protein